MQMVQETGRIECPGTALYDYKTYKIHFTQEVFCEETAEKYARALAHSMRLTKEMVGVNVFHRGFGG